MFTDNLYFAPTLLVAQTLGLAAQAQQVAAPTPLERPDAALPAAGPLALERPSAPVSPPQPSLGGAPGFIPIASFMTRHETREGYRALGRSAGRFQEGEAAVFRARMGFRTTPIDTGGPDVVLQFTPQASGWIGYNANTITDYNLGLHEGFLRLTEKGVFSLDVGRFELNYGDALVIGNLGWHQTARAFEGMRARLHIDKAWVDLFVTQLDEGRPLSDPIAAGDQYLYGVYADVGPLMAPQMHFDLYALGQSFAAANTVEDGVLTGRAEPATEVTLGGRVKQSVGVFNYRVEAGAQFGNRQLQGQTLKAGAYQVDGEIGVAPSSKFRIHLGGAYATGDDPNTEKQEGWNELYPTGHKFLGLTDVFGARTNLASLNGGVWAKPSSRVALASQLHRFWRLETPADIDGYVGTELDSHIVLTLGKGLKLRSMYGVFFANELGPFQADGLAHFWETELSFNL